MPKPKPSPKAADPRVESLLAVLQKDPKIAPSVAEYRGQQATGGRKAFGSNGLKVESQLFALFTQDTLVVKLPRDRVTALIAEGVGRPFDPGHGRLMRQWLTVTSPTASWSDLTREAFAYVGLSS